VYLEMWHSWRERGVLVLSLLLLGASAVLFYRDPGNVLPAAVFVEQPERDLGSLAVGNSHEITFRIVNRGHAQARVLGGWGT